jgi:predicted nucleic acid-binding Zn ribbon protein
MQCPLCAAELGDDAVVCERCGAVRATRRTPAGIVVGWLGMTVALLMVMMWAFLIALPLFGISLAGFPWTTLIVGSLIAAGLLWHSKTTQHRVWLRREK